MGPRDIVEEGKDGYLSDDLQEAAMKCLNLSQEDCRKKAEQYSWERSADAFIQNLFPVK
jgi:glycosyltransferase involved in cell wall biosynthesis